MHIDVARRPHQQNEENTPQNPKRSAKCDHSPKHEQTLANLKLTNLVQSDTRTIATTRAAASSSAKQLALTFGTLLSSQSTDAHPQRPLDRFGGNPGNTTRSGSQCQLPVPASPLPPLPVRRPRPILKDPAIGGSRSPALKVRIGATRRTVRTGPGESQTVAGATFSAGRDADRRVPIARVRSLGTTR